MQREARYVYIRLLLYFSLALQVTLTIIHAWTSWRSEFDMSGAAGVWTTLAADFNQGVFYRPLSGPLGYGGTRYFPLHFIVQAALMRAGLGAIDAGRVIELVSLLVLIAAIYLLLRRLGVRPWLSTASAFLPLATPSVQSVVGNIRGDIMPGALNLLGLAFGLEEKQGWRRVLVPSIFFTLAFAAKPTTIFGLATLTLALLLKRHFRTAGKLVSLTALGYVLVLASIQVASGGRAFGIFSACALTGGGWASILLKGPLNLVLEAAGETPRNGVVFIVLGCASLLAWRSKETLIPPLFLLTTMIVSAFIMGTPGADGNHLVDLYVASIIVLVTSLEQQSEQALRWGLCVIVTAVVLTLPEQAVLVEHAAIDAQSKREVSEQLLELTKGLSRPVLAENPLLSIRAGQTPYVLDPFMFRILNERTPSYADGLWRRLRARSFGAVVLDLDPESDFGQSWYTSTDFGPDFLNELNANYYLQSRMGEHLIYLPRGR